MDDEWPDEPASSSSCAAAAGPKESMGTSRPNCQEKVAKKRLGMSQESANSKRAASSSSAVMMAAMSLSATRARSTELRKAGLHRMTPRGQRLLRVGSDCSGLCSEVLCLELLLDPGEVSLGHVFVSDSEVTHGYHPCLQAELGQLFGWSPTVPGQFGALGLGVKFGLRFETAFRMKLDKSLLLGWG